MERVPPGTQRTFVGDAATDIEWRWSSVYKVKDGESSDRGTGAVAENWRYVGGRWYSGNLTFLVDLRWC